MKPNPVLVLLPIAAVVASTSALANPANRGSLNRLYGRFLTKRLDACATCHIGSAQGRIPESLAEFPHNPFGARLRKLGEEWKAAGRTFSMEDRLQAVSREDADGDGVSNHDEILHAKFPGDPEDAPSKADRLLTRKLASEFERYLKGYRWLPFDPVRRPPVPRLKGYDKSASPIDSFLERERRSRGLVARPEAGKAQLLRRVYLDLIGLSPTVREQEDFLADASPTAYEKVVDRLLASPKYGERWGRHWMDVWRYSDWAGWTDGGQIRDSQPHIWRWKDWIVESLNADKGYDRMLLEMVAADEASPEDERALRATGFLARNYKMLSREKWMEDTVGHAARAFLGLSMQCAKCHDHMYDPVTQQEYYELRAVFEPHNVRIDRVPGQTDTKLDGLPRVYDADLATPTYFFPRGDDRHPDKNRAMTPGVPRLFAARLEVQQVKLTELAYRPDHREFVRRDLVEDARKAAAEARSKSDKAKPGEERELAEAQAALAEAHRVSLEATLAAERLEGSGKTPEWSAAARLAAIAQRQVAVHESRLALLNAERALAKAEAGTEKGKAQVPELRKKLDEAKQLLARAEEAAKGPATTDYKPRDMPAYPAVSTGRRLAFGKWLGDPKNPLAARVAVNHIWARHFGEGIVPSTDDFGRNGRPPSHPELLDWLAAELMESNWSMKRLHRLIVTSAAYRMASTPLARNLEIDPDNRYLWRMSSRRAEAEVVRDNLLWCGGALDETMGGPEIDHMQGLTSRRRSLYLRIAPEKETEFLQQFDSPSVTECYARKHTVVPQQALALSNSSLAIEMARTVAAAIGSLTGSDNDAFIRQAFQRVLARAPAKSELRECRRYLAERVAVYMGKAGARVATVGDVPARRTFEESLSRARESMALILFNHNDFVTVR